MIWIFLNLNHRISTTLRAKFTFVFLFFSIVSSARARARASNTRTIGAWIYRFLETFATPIYTDRRNCGCGERRTWRTRKWHGSRIMSIFKRNNALLHLAAVRRECKARRYVRILDLLVSLQRAFCVRIRKQERGKKNLPFRSTYSVRSCTVSLYNRFLIPADDVFAPIPS